MKILCVIDSLCFGGAQRQLVELAVAFNEKGHFVSFLTYHDIPFFKSKVEDAGITITCIQETNYIKRLLKMRRFIRQGDYHAVLSFLEAANFISILSGFPYRKWKLVVGERSADPKILKSFKLKVYRWFHLFADHIVANSNANMQFVQNVNPLLSDSKCHIIYNTVDFDYFRPLKNFVYKTKQKLSLVVAARIRYEKNLHGLIEALSLLKKEEQDQIKIDWYGKYDELSGTNNLLVGAFEKIKRSRLEKVITFHDATHDIKRKIQESDAVGLFSFYEGFPNIICEAMACEKPVICTNVSDVSHFLSHDPRLLCDPNDPNSIKEALRYLIKLDHSKLKKIGTTNRTIALQRFEKESIVASYLHLLGA
jgi:glycosyltransferase involved in cell wall biosynthesis